MDHRITTDGQERDIVIRAMDEGFIVWRKMFTPPLTAENMETADPEYLAEGRGDGRFDVFKEFFRKQIQTIGSCAILAWDGDGVIGKMRFTTREMWDAVRQAHGWLCVDNDKTAGTLQKFTDDQLDRLLASESRTLHIICFNVGHFDSRYHGKGIAKDMIDFLKEWARERGWRRLEALSCPDVVPFRAVGPQVLRRSVLERRGFHVDRESRASAEKAAGRRKAIQRIVSGDLDQGDWDVKTYPSNIEKVRQLARDPSWQDEYDRDYVMACDL